MAKWVVILEDGRETGAYAPDEAGAKKQANAHEIDRALIADKRGMPREYDPSLAVSARKVKD